jgi:flagellar biosynthesis protein FliQ
MKQPDNETTDTFAGRSFTEHYAASQFRTERWNQLKNQTASLSSASNDKAPVDALRATVRESLDLLLRIEHYWAFPGKHTCLELANLFERGWYRALERNTARIVRLLVGDSYRRRDVSAVTIEEIREDDPVVAPDAPIEAAAARELRPYFELLVVDDLDATEQQELRERLVKVRSPDDEFRYEIVVVPSFEDAVIAAMLEQGYTVLPVGQGMMSEAVMGDLLTRTSQLFAVALQMTAPMMAVAFIVMLVFALLGRAVSQINSFFESFAFRVLSGLAVFGLTMNLMSRHIINYLQRLPGDMLEICRLLGA